MGYSDREDVHDQFIKTSQLDDFCSANQWLGMDEQGELQG